MSIKNVDLSNNTNKITGNIEENLNNNNILTTNNSKVSNEQEFKIVKNYQNNLPNVIDVKTTMLGVLGILNFSFYCHNCINHSF